MIKKYIDKDSDPKEDQNSNTHDLEDESKKLYDPFRMLIEKIDYTNIKNFINDADGIYNSIDDYYIQDKKIFLLLKPRTYFCEHEDSKKFIYELQLHLTKLFNLYFDDSNKDNHSDYISLLWFRLLDYARWYINSIHYYNQLHKFPNLEDKDIAILIMHKKIYLKQFILILILYRLGVPLSHVEPNVVLQQWAFSNHIKYEVIQDIIQTASEFLGVTELMLNRIVGTEIFDTILCELSCNK
jgi:hypothetical protein